MLLSQIRKPSIILFCFCLIVNPMLYAQTTNTTVDFDPPEVEHIVGNSVLPENTAATITASVRDNVEVKSVVLHFRSKGEQEYSARAMSRSGETELYILTLEASEIKQPGLDYYLEATDTTGNAVLEGFPLIPLTLTVGRAIANPTSDSNDTAGSGVSKKTWIWIGLGVLVAGALASSGGGSSGSDDTGLVVEIPKP